MSFGALLADLDATAFKELADDPRSIWQPVEGDAVFLAAMLEEGERAINVAGMPGIGGAPLIRLSVAEVAAKSAIALAAGQRITVCGVDYVIHGDPWQDDEMGGRDWLCPVSKL